MSSEKLDYLSIGESIDGTNFCSGVETLAENIIEDNEKDAAICFPSLTGWARLQSESYRLTDENAEIILPYPIYKIKSVKLKVSSVDASFADGALKLTDFVDKNNRPFSESELDITKFIVTADEWKALEQASTQYAYVYGLFKDNTFYWEKGSNKLPILGKVYTIGTIILGGIFAEQTPAYVRVLRSALFAIGENYREKDWDGTWNEANRTLSNIAATYALDVTDVRDWLFRVEYIPVSIKTKIRARKSEKQEVEYLQPFNQRAEINAASAFGKNMWLTAQKTGTRVITVVKNYTKLTDIPPLGALVRHNGKRYRLVANSYKQTNTVYVQVTHTLSENWTSKSKHVSVDQKYRNYNIPQDILWRNMYWEDYITVTGNPNTVNGNDAGIQLSDALHIFKYYSNHDSTIDSFVWGFDETEIPLPNIGVTVPCSTYGIANSMVFSASFKDNLSAGLKENLNAKDEEKAPIFEEALYCKQNGRLDTAYVVLSDGIMNANADLVEDTSEEKAERGRKEYPSVVSADGYVYNAPKKVLFNKRFYVDKDPGEAIKFTYQVHFVTEGDCVVGNKLAEHNTLIKRYEKSENARTLRVWLLKNYIREGEDKLQPTGNDASYTRIGANAFFTLTSRTDGRYVLELVDAVKRLLGGYKAWAITDENNNLYVGRNENTDGFVHFCIGHKRP